MFLIKLNTKSQPEMVYSVNFISAGPDKLKIFHLQELTINKPIIKGLGLGWNLKSIVYHFKKFIIFTH